MINNSISNFIDRIAEKVMNFGKPKGLYTKDEPYTCWIDHLHGEIRMVAIRDPDGEEICIVLERQADELLAHLNR